MFEQLRADVRYAASWLLRSPGFATVAIASLAIGIGFNTALFSIVDALLLRPLPIERPDTIIDIYTKGADGDTYSTTSYPDYLDLKAQNKVLTDMAGYSPAIAAVKMSDQSRMALGEVVTGNYFQVLGVKAALGRTLVPDDDRPGAPRAIALSHRIWMRDYAGDPAVLGRTMQIRGQSYTIVGVIEQQFNGMVPMLQPEMWLPLAWVEEIEPAGIQDVVPSPTGTTRIDRRGQRWLFIKGRLKEGETKASAEANLQVIMSQLAATHPKTNRKRPIAVASNVRVHPQADAAMRPIAAGLMLGVGLVLLVACVNVANMLLARASGRQREIGIRLAIGASRSRLIRQLLTESVVLALLGAAAGIGLAILLLAFVQSIPLPVPVPLALTLGIDARVLTFSIGLASLAGLLAGLAPALKATKPNLTAELKGDRRAMSSGSRRWTLRDALLVAQTAVTLVLLVAAGLLTRSIFKAQQVDLGFTAGGLAVLGTEVGLIGYDEAKADALYDRAVERVRALPGVQSVAATVRQPLAINYNRTAIFFPDRQAPGDPGLPTGSTWVDDSYFATLGVPLLHGRNFSTADTPSTPKVAVVNESFARKHWPGDDALGRRFRVQSIDGPEYQVVGVVSDYKVDTVGERPAPYIHYALGQRQFTGQVLMARTAGDASALLAAMRREVLSLEPNAIFLDSQTMSAQVDMALLPARLAAQTASLVGLISTVLAAIGLYGVIAYAVARRTREIGIRMALGAAPGGVIGLVMKQGLTVAVAGCAVGAIIAYVAARAIASGLYGVSALDPLAWTGAVAALLGSAAVANFLPARRASRVDPSVALRTE
ncbi:MAG TPA: ABC transporter permease [Vicinamibacterales bacterium]|nr:ABC transporter permease [Vicinamibacterales bacterium]